ncbi:hypothetical protein JKF63_04246 [Porcisia hertigi]|uniref:Thioesterase domain-containing protein n=1 Tax=Porcisia hertigi TaxID=2761500 RepID=A0A836IE10_9TRYP|nr:hypothetical protein JKF63_04246 [Porcisia hertigi]
MLFLHLLRCQRFVLRGLCDRVRVSKMISGASPIPVKDALLSVLPEAAVTSVGSALRRPSRPLFARLEWPWIRHLPRSRSFGHFIAQPITIPVYCGFRMIDGLGHVNNAKYLEICELARWHQLSFLGLGLGAVRRRLAFIVSDVSITYQREIGPRCTVCVVTRILLAPPRSTMDGPSSSSSLEEASLSDQRRIFVEQEIWSRDGRRLHAALTFAAAIMGPTEYHQELTQRYDPPASAAATHSPERTPVRPRTALNCEHCLADILGLSSVEELRRLFDSVEHPKRRVSDVGDSAAAAAAAAAEEAVAPDQDSAGRQEHITRLAQIWRTLRNRMRHKTLASPPTPPSTSSNAPNTKTDSKL